MTDMEEKLIDIVEQDAVVAGVQELAEGRKGEAP